MNFEFMHFEERVRADSDDGTRWLYRGQARPEWKLETRLLRHCQRLCLPFSLEYFFELLDAFIDHASDFLGADLVTLNLCQRIALGQHHGIPTPFLDWTESPYVAAFFALSERCGQPSDGPFTVWALRYEGPVSDGADLTRHDLLEVAEPFRLLRPKVYQSRRLSRQFGYFTFFGRGESMDEHLHDAKVVVKRYDVAGTRSARMLSQLHLMGISATNLFDDLGGVALDALIRHDRDRWS